MAYFILRHTYHPDAYLFGGFFLFLAIVALVVVTYFPLYAIHVVARSALRRTISNSKWLYVRLSRVILILTILGGALTFNLPLAFTLLPYRSDFNKLAATYQNDPTIPIKPSSPTTPPLPGGPVFIGPYTVTGVNRIAGGVLFFVDNGDSGFAYIPSSSPGSLFNTDADGYLGGGWWYFIEG